MTDASPATGTRSGARRLAPIVLVNAIGNGLFFTISALYFTRAVGISTTQLGVGLTAGGICGALAAIPVARAAERWDPRRVTIVIWLLEAAGMVAYTQVRSFWAFLALVCVVVMLDRSAGAGYRVLIAQALVHDDRTRGRSLLRAVANTGMGVGAASGAVALQFDTRTAFSVAILFNAATFVGAAALLTRVALPERAPRVPGGPASTVDGRTRLQVLRDGPFLVLTVLSMVLTLQFALLEIGLPLWTAGHTTAPHATVAAALVVNTAMVALLQVRLSRGSEDLGKAARLCRYSGLLLAAGCLVFATAAGASPWSAVLIILAGAALQTMAEIFFSIGSMALSYDLVPEKGSGAYHGVFQAGYIVALLIAPLAITNTALRFGVTGWAALAGVFAVAGALFVPVTRWAQRTRAPVAAAATA